MRNTVQLLFALTKCVLEFDPEELSDSATLAEANAHLFLPLSSAQAAAVNRSDLLAQARNGNAASAMSSDSDSDEDETGKPKSSASANKKRKGWTCLSSHLTPPLVLTLDPLQLLGIWYFYSERHA